MAYCSFSDMDYQCDLYIYDDINGMITIHVANSRAKYLKPLPPESEKFNFERWEIVNSMFINAGTVGIDLPYAGETFHNLSQQEAVEKVKELIELGYRCPEYVLKELENEYISSDL